ncbi:hypothetical protein THASP1DRAFT_33615, partial [Thamnocephalis sphaerospora]
MHFLRLLLASAALLLAAHDATALPAPVEVVQQRAPSQDNVHASSSSSFGSFSNFPRPLSPKAQQVFNAVMQAANQNPGGLTTPTSYLATSGRLLNLSVQTGPDDTLCKDFYADVALKAQEEVVMETYMYDRQSRCAMQMADAVRALDAKARASNTRIRVYILMDTFGVLNYL